MAASVPRPLVCDLSALSGADAETAARYGLALSCLKHGLPGDSSLFTQSDIDAFLAGERDVRR